MPNAERGADQLVGCRSAYVGRRHGRRSCAYAPGTGVQGGRIALTALLETCRKLRLPAPTCRRNLPAMILYGIASALSDDIEDWYPSREEAEATVAGILRDEPDFEGELWVEAIEFEQSLN